MEIKLLINEKEKTFIAPRPKGRIVRDAVTIVEKMDINKMQGKDMDALIDFMVKVYDKQFTRDDVYDGLYADELMTSLIDTVQTVVNGTAKRLEPKND